MSQRFRIRLLTMSLAVATTTILTGCGLVGTGAELITPSTAPFANPQLSKYSGILVSENVLYGTADAKSLLLDICLPPNAAPLASVSNAAVPLRAILVVHGGSWRAGDKTDSNWRNVCEWLASEGFAAFNINYRLAPNFVYPAQIDDLRTAVRWLREPDQVAKYNIDPERIGALGGSAGGNLVALLGLEGSGALDVGTRVSAVVDLSGPVDLTVDGAKATNVTDEFQATQAAYLGCTTLARCPQARAASPLFDIDETDPPFFVANSTRELIPLAQASEFVRALRAAGVDTGYVKVTGNRHSTALLEDEMKSRIITFLSAKLGGPLPKSGQK